VSRIFVSHSSKDNRQAVALQAWLIAQDPPLANEIFLDTDPHTGLKPGVKWKNELVSANSRCEAVICLLSKNWESSAECLAEYRTAENMGKQILCGRLEDRTGRHTSDWQHCDLFANGLREEDVVKIPVRGGEPVVFAKAGLHQLREAIRGAGIAAENFVWPPPNQPDRAPYRGWEPFEEVDAGVFFGRDAQIVRAMDMLRAMRTGGVDSLFVVLGPSGSGKSSFLRAGLLPRLRREDRHVVLLDIMRPERHTLTGETGLAHAIYAGRRRLGLEHPPLGDIETACTGDPATVRDLLAECRQAAAKRLPDADLEAAPPTLVLPLDQAEELFSADAGPEAAAFLTLIAELAKPNADGQRLGLIVAATIRTDRYEVMQTAPELAGLTAEVFDDLKPMPANQFREVVTGPAARASHDGHRLTIAPDLVNRLLDDAAEGGDALPLLALTMRRLYDRYAATGQLTVANYEVIGGMRKVVQTAVNEVLSADPGQRARELDELRTAFIPWLATINPDNDQPMRRVARYSELPETSRPLIDAFMEKRLLVKDRRGGQVVVEVALESLLRQWDDLADWLREESQRLKTAEDAQRNATAWDKDDRNDAWLLTGSRLADAEELLTAAGYRDRLANQPTCDYLAASRLAENQRLQQEEDRRQEKLRHAEDMARLAQERQQAAEELAAEEQAHAAVLRRRSRILRAVLVGTAIVAIIAVVFAVIAYTKSKEAAASLQDSTSRRLDYEAQAILAGSLRGGDIRAFQELLAARALTDKPDNGALLDALSKRLSTNKIAYVPALANSVWAFSPDGKTIATGGKDNAVQLWSTDTGQLLRTFSGHTDSVTSVAFSPDGHRLASASLDKTLRLWNPDTGKEIGYPITGHTDIVNSVAFSPSGHLLATASADNTARIWNAETGQPIGEPLIGHTDTVTQALFSPDAQRLATASLDGTVRFWDTNTAHEIGAPSVAPGAGVIGIAFQPDGSQLASVSTDGAIQLWDPYTGLPLTAPLKKHQSTVTAVAFSPGGMRLVSGGSDGALQAWSLRGSLGADAIGWPTVGHLGAVTGVVLSVDGQHFTSGGADSTVRTWNFAGAPPIIDLKAPVTSVVFNPDGTTIAEAGGDLRLWDAKTLEQSGRAIPNSVPDVHGMVFSRDGSRLATANNDGTVQLWNTSSHEAIQPPPPRLTAGLQISLFGSSADGRGVVVLTDGTMRIWDADSGQLQGPPVLKDIPLPQDQRLTSIALNPSGHLAVIGTSGGTLQRINTQTGQKVGDPMAGHTDAVSSIAISPDGHTIASGGDDRTVRLWNADTGDAIGIPLTGHTDAVTSVAFSPDGRLVVSGSPDGTLRLWPGRSSTADLCDKLTTNMSQKQWREWVSPNIGYKDQCPRLLRAPD
jgi:WD40 repeat protein